MWLVSRFYLTTETVLTEAQEAKVREVGIERAQYLLVDFAIDAATGKVLFFWREAQPSVAPYPCRKLILM